MEFQTLQIVETDYEQFQADLEKNRQIIESIKQRIGQDYDNINYPVPLFEQLA